MTVACVIRISRVEQAIRAHDWCCSDDSSSMSWQRAESIRMGSVNNNEQERIVARLVPAPATITSRAEAKALLAYITVGQDMMGMFTPLLPFEHYNMFSEEECMVYDVMQDQAVGVVGKIDWLQMYIDLLTEMMLV